MGMRNDLVTGAVEAQRFTKRNVVVQRQRTVALIALLQLIAIILLAEFFSKLNGSWIGGIARSKRIVLLEHLGIELDMLVICIIHTGIDLCRGSICSLTG